MDSGMIPAFKNIRHLSQSWPMQGFLKHSDGGIAHLDTPRFSNRRYSSDSLLVLFLYSIPISAKVFFSHLVNKIQMSVGAPVVFVKFKRDDFFLCSEEIDRFPVSLYEFFS